MLNRGWAFFMAYTKDEFYNFALNELSNVETLAERVQIGGYQQQQPSKAKPGSQGRNDCVQP